MAPAFIADSDDESEGNTFSPPPAAQAEDLPSFTSTGSEPVSLATSSTDPVFFQGIYKEQQIAAAREQQLRDGAGGSTNLQLTAPPGTEQTDPVSLPSQYPEGTPLAVGDANRGYTSHAVKSAIMREKLARQDLVGSADPYAFPSSGEEGQSGGGRQAGWTTATTYTGAGDADVGENEKMGPPSRKRQRLSRRGNDAVDSSLPPTAPPIHSSIPPTMPPGYIDETIGADNAEIPSTLVPTISISEDPSLIINPRGLTSSQKEQYVAVELPLSSNPERQNELADISTQLLPQSSRKSQRQKTPSKKSTPPKPRAARQRRDKSQPTEDAMGSVQLGTPEQTQSTAVLPDSEDEAFGQDDTQAAKENEPEDDIYEIQPSPVKATKKRGRPKKVEKKTEQTEQATVVQPAAAEAKNPEKTAKRRGRPRKSEAVVVEEHEEEVTKVNAEQTPTKVAEGDVAKNETEDATSANLDDVTTLQGIKVDDDEETPEAAAVTAKQTPQKPTGNGKATPQRGSAGKPLYRIGLSKRSRIAPLLKSLPK